MKNGKPVPRIPGAMAALRRAARKARALHKRTNTPFYVVVDGKIRDLNAKKRRAKSKTK